MTVLKLVLQHDGINQYAAVIIIAHTLHTIIADFFRVKITSVAFATAVAYPVIHHTLLDHGYRLHGLIVPQGIKRCKNSERLFDFFPCYML